ncbi:hypothetical protein NQZ68_040421 [Dissostichus eleginoides]|nr:hypothetical protein NQZ68_040421 [Dissostichus eleginoides]
MSFVTGGDNRKTAWGSEEVKLYHKSECRRLQELTGQEFTALSLNPGVPLSFMIAGEVYRQTLELMTTSKESLSAK